MGMAIPIGKQLHLQDSICKGMEQQDQFWGGKTLMPFMLELFKLALKNSFCSYNDYQIEKYDLPSC